MNSTLRLLCLPLVASCLTSCGLLSIPTQILGTALNTVHLADAKKKDKDKDNALEVATTDGKDKPAATASEGTLGEVSYVDTESGFILIRQAPGRRIVASTPLLSKNPTGSITAKLLSSPATKGSFVAADIVSGAPERGNPVMMDPDAKTKAPAKPTIAPPADATTPAGPGPAGQRPKLEPILPPLGELKPPSGDLEAPPLPSLPQ